MWPSLGLLSTEEYDDAAACLPHGDKNRESQTGVICWVSEGQFGSLEKSNDRSRSPGRGDVTQGNVNLCALLHYGEF